MLADLRGGWREFVSRQWLWVAVAQLSRPVMVATLLTLPTALPYVLLGVGAPLWSIVRGALVAGVCFDIYGVLWNTTVQREIPGESLSRVSSYDSLGSLMLGPLGMLLAGPLAVTIGPRPALIGCGVMVVLVSMPAVLFPGVRELRVPDVRAAPVRS